MQKLVTQSNPNITTPGKNGEVVKQIGIYSISAQLTQLITLVAAILSRRFLGPTMMGVWAMLQIVVEYSKYSSLGTLHAVAREIPYCIGKGEHEKADEIKNVVFTTLLIFSGALALGIILFALVTAKRFDTPVTLGLMLISCIVVLQLINNLMVQLLRSYKDFALLSKQMIASAVVNAILVASLTYYFQIYGFICAMIFSFVFNIAFITSNRNFRLRWMWKPERLKKLVIFGIPLIFMGFAATVLRSVDKIMIVKYLGFENLGFYTIALMMSAYIATFLNSMAIVLIPHFQERYAADDNKQTINIFLDKASSAYAMLMPLLIGGVWIVAPFFVGLVLDQYVPGIEAMKASVLGIYFLSLTQSYQDYLVTIKRHFSLFPILFGTFLFAIASNAAAIRGGYGIYGIAIATTITFWLQFTLIYFLTSKHLEYGRREAWIRYMKLVLFGGFGMACILLSGKLLSSIKMAELLRISAQYFVFVILYSPVLWALNKRFDLFHILCDQIKSKIMKSSRDAVT